MNLPSESGLHQIKHSAMEAETTDTQFRCQAQKIIDDLLPLAERQLNALVPNGISNPSAKLADIRVQVRNLGRSAGKAIGDTVIINRQLVDHPDELRSTVAHELAHIVVERARRLLRIRRRKGQWAAHGTIWRGVALALGDTGKRCHQLDLKPSRNVSRFLYRLPDGTERHLSAIRHHRLQRNRHGFYHWPGDSEPVRWHHLVGRVTFLHDGRDA